MRTYQQPFGGWAGGARLLAGLALVVACAARRRRPAAEVSRRARRRRRLPVVRLATPSWTARPGASAGSGCGCRSTSRSRWRAAFSSPNSKTGDKSVSVKTFGISALYNFLIGSSNSFYLKAGGGLDQVRRRAAPASASPDNPICGSSGALLGGRGLPGRADAHDHGPRRGPLQPEQEQGPGDRRRRDAVQLRRQRWA